MEITTVASNNPVLVIAALFVALGIIWKAAKETWRFIRRIHAFLNDYMGEPARPGVPAKPGMTERVWNIEHELHPNSGASMRDSIDRVEVGLTEIKDIAVAAQAAAEVASTAAANAASTAASAAATAAAVAAQAANAAATDRATMLSSLTEDRVDRAHADGVVHTPKAD